MENNILIIDSDISLKKILVKSLSGAKNVIRAVSTISEAWVEISKNFYDLILMDIELPDGDGLEFVEKIRKKKLSTKIIVISAKHNILTTVKASELNVYEYISKPIDLNDLIIVVSRCLQKDRSNTHQLIVDDEKLPMIGNSQAMQSVYRTIAKLMKTDLTVLITGESGTGKELVAKAIHDYSSRVNKDFVVLNMAAIPRDLIESELFGYEKGAFTGAEKTTIGYFEKAEKGTLFLDEIGDMPFEVQARLLRVLQMGEYSRVGGREVIKSDVRIISATNKNLKECVESGTFREDLYYRLNVVKINVPHLRDRKSDIILLSNFFLKKFSNGSKKINEDCIKLLEKYKWPGNVRELENFFKKISVLYSDNQITTKIIEEELSDIDESSHDQISENSISDSMIIHLSNFFEALNPDDDNSTLNLYEKLLTEFEKPLIAKALDFFNGNQIKTAAMLGINRNTLRKKIKDLKIILKK
ncbi:MAG: nitrogen regulation protein NR(I) [Rickettsiales bacterium]|nr:nitrogen regulation protein NR(I) [Rickettsiales bacterium]